MAEMKENTRSFSRVRSRAFRSAPRKPLLRRANDQGLVAVPAAPLDRYLKARGSDPPRTWVSGLSERLERSGAEHIVTAAKAMFRDSVRQLLADPKGADPSGDYFLAWLRACNRDVYDDIDKSEPEKLCAAKTVPSVNNAGSSKNRHNLRDIRIPSIEAAFTEFAKFDPDKRSTTKRERVLSQIIVDIFQLRLVDMASVLKVADVVCSVPEGARVVVVLYLGSDHVHGVIDFWRAQGFTHKGLPGKGLVGKDALIDSESRALKFPPYLHDFDRLFPVP
eukprot:gnl/TRDRNA2_/TRDRNA2_125120_c1_seq2.p1 gnl/TRDRNA2_/TRDRNA2_125120_c1~~gnl/TRDRNA2_/TRDRNA2_125120_c1_seq2.p1  ORF type:complete len:278 (+),score=29.87 gnl/TRDRNA2_/TRDRNA2_125120_c1_seq2:14-847(+)